MTSPQNIVEKIQDKLSQGLINADEANIQMVENLRIKVIKGKLSRQVRNALNQGVKSKRLGRVKKDGLKPEIYYKVNFKHLAVEEQNRVANKSISKLSNVFA